MLDHLNSHSDIWLESKSEGKHVETIAFLIGFRENDALTATDITFQAQQGTSTHVVNLHSTLFYM